MYVMMAMPLATTACIQRVGHCFTPPTPPKKMFVLSVFYLQCSYFPSFAVFKLFVIVVVLFYRKCSYFPCFKENVHIIYIYIRDEVVSVSRWVRHITLM